MTTIKTMAEFKERAKAYSGAMVKNQLPKDSGLKAKYAKALDVPKKTFKVVKVRKKAKKK